MDFSWEYILAFAAAFSLSVSLTFTARKIALRLGIVDVPGKERKIHKKPVPLLGGAAIFSTFFIVLAVFVFFGTRIFSDTLAFKNVVGVFIASCFLIIGGILDDKYDLSPKKQLIWPFLAAVIVVASGIGVKHITNLFGGTISLEIARFHVAEIRGIPYYFSWPADILTFLWLLGMMYSIKLLDGLDGLVSGIASIGSLIIFGFCLFTAYYQPDIALISAIMAGACLGFLVFNFHPAKIFLGEGGSTFCGFMLGVLAIISGGKFATALLVAGVALLDMVWIITRRVFWEKRTPFSGDRKHIHFRLLDAGLSHRQAVIFLYLLSGGFGLASLFLQSRQKAVALLILAAAMVGLGSFLVIKARRRTD